MIYIRKNNNIKKNKQVDQLDPWVAPWFSGMNLRAIYNYSSLLLPDSLTDFTTSMVSDATQK